MSDRFDEKADAIWAGILQPFLTLDSDDKWIKKELAAVLREAGNDAEEEPVYTFWEAEIARLKSELDNAAKRQRELLKVIAELEKPFAKQ